MVELAAGEVLNGGGQRRVELRAEAQARHPGVLMLINQENIVMDVLVSGRGPGPAAKHQPVQDWVGALLEFH